VFNATAECSYENRASTSGALTQVLARQNISGLCAVRRGVCNALRFQSVGEHAGIGSAIALRIIGFHAALVAPGRAHRHQRRNRASSLQACRGACRSKASQRAASCQATRTLNSRVSVFQSSPLRHNLGLTGRSTRPPSVAKKIVRPCAAR
jgi:hypothetical protein